MSMCLARWLFSCVQSRRTFPMQCAAGCAQRCRTAIDTFITEKQKKEKNPFQCNSKSVLNDFCISIRWLLRSLHGPFYLTPCEVLTRWEKIFIDLEY